MIRLAADPEASETVALRALAYLASDDDRLSRFLAWTGLTLGEVRAAIADRRLLGGILDYVMEHEGLLIEFSARIGLDPGAVTALRRDLPGYAPPA